MSTARAENKGKVAIVTGAAQGIGACIARRLAQDGFDVVIADLETSQKKADAVAAEAKSGGGRVAVIPVDVRSEESIQNLVDKTVAELGRVDSEYAWGQLALVVFRVRSPCFCSLSPRQLSGSALTHSHDRQRRHRAARRLPRHDQQDHGGPVGDQHPRRHVVLPDRRSADDQAGRRGSAHW